MHVGRTSASSSTALPSRPKRTTRGRLSTDPTGTTPTATVTYESQERHHGGPAHDARHRGQRHRFTDRSLSR